MRRGDCSPETQWRPVRLTEALLLGASVLIRAHEFSRSLEMLAEAKVLLGADDQLWLTRTDDMIETQMLLGPHEHGWLLGTHEMLVSWNMASFGRLDEAEGQPCRVFNTSTRRVKCSWS